MFTPPATAAPQGMALPTNGFHIGDGYDGAAAPPRASVISAFGVDPSRSDRASRCASTAFCWCSSIRATARSAARLLADAADMDDCVSADSTTAVFAAAPFIAASMRATRVQEMAAATALVATSVTCGRIDRGNGEKDPLGLACGRARATGCQGETKEDEGAKRDWERAAGEDEGTEWGKLPAASVGMRSGITPTCDGPDGQG